MLAPEEVTYVAWDRAKLLERLDSWIMAFEVDFIWI